MKITELGRKQKDFKHIDKLSIRVLFLVSICFWSNATFAKTSNLKKDFKNYNVVFIAVDALQARKVSHLGYNRPTTPTIDQLANSGVSFSQAISPSSWTVPTYLSIFTSAHPSVHGLTNRYKIFNEFKEELSDFKKDNPKLTTIAEIFKSNGYATAGFTGNSGLTNKIGYGKGFDTYTDEKIFGGLENSLSHANAWLEKNKNKKFFMFLHGYDAHGQFDMRENYNLYFKSEKTQSTKFKGNKEEQAEIREKGLANSPVQLSEVDLNFWRDWYDSKIHDTDERLSKFLQFYKSLNIKNTIFVLFSDHGTEFYEHGRFDHGHTLYDELIHVPLVFNFGEKQKKLIVHEQVTTLDILPTMIDLLNLKINPQVKKQMKGRSLKNAFSGKKIQSQDVFSETDLQNYTHKRSIRTPDWKLILTLESGAEELYNLKSDPMEKNNLTLVETKKAAELRKKLINHLDEMKTAANSLSYFRLTTDCLPVYNGQCKKK